MKTILKKIRWIGLIAVCVMVLLWDLKIGSVSISWAQMVHWLWEGLCGRALLISNDTAVIFFMIRLPRVIMAALVGALLSAVGAALQSLFRNPLSDPYLLGVSSGAALGAVFGLSLGWFFPAPLACLGAVVALGIVLLLSREGSGVSVSMMVLTGVAIHSFSSAILTLMLSRLSGRYESAGIFFWLLGSLSTLPYHTLVPVVATSAVGLAALMVWAPSLNLLAQGEEAAGTLGLNVELTKWILILLCALLTGLAVTFNGMIPFVGLVVPHMTRLLTGPDHRKVLPLSALMGAVLVATADALGRTILAPQEIPTGVVTALAGARALLPIYTPPGKAETFMNLLDVKGVSFSYPPDMNGSGRAAFSLDGVNLELSSGTVLGILGPNGGGKSTLLRLLCGRLRPSGGEILIDGQSVGDLSAKALARQIALVPQEISTIFAVSVREMVSLGLFPWTDFLGWRMSGRSDLVDEVLRQTDLWDLQDRLTSEISGGERRRVLLARALVQQPRLLLLDEPTAHMDPRHQVDFIQLLDRLRREKNMGVIAVLHDVNLALAWCSSLLLMKEGKVQAFGKTDGVVTESLLEKVYGLSAESWDIGRNGQRYIDFFKALK